MKGVTLDFSRRSKPTDNAFIAFFNGKFRAECLNLHWFMSLDDAVRKCEAFGVETTTKYDRTARSETSHRCRSCWHQRHMARLDVSALENRQQGGPETGSSSQKIHYL